MEKEQSRWCGIFAGPLLVAKESRFNEDLLQNDELSDADLISFHRIFYKTQVRA